MLIAPLAVKVWSKRRYERLYTFLVYFSNIYVHRKINSPYKGTLSSYGYVLLVIYFLVHVKNLRFSLIYNKCLLYVRYPRYGVPLRELLCYSLI